MNIALQTGRDLKVPLLATAQAAAIMDKLLAEDKGELDHSAKALFLE